MSFHDENTGPDNHGPYAAVFADADARDNDPATYQPHQALSGGANPVRSFQLDTRTEWVLADNNPVTWVPLGAAAGVVGTFTFGDPSVVTPDAGVLTLDFGSAQKHRVELDQHVTSVVVIDPTGAGNFMIEIVQDATGGWDISGWPAPPRVRWLNGTVPTFGDAALAERLVSVYFNGPTLATYKGEYNAGTYS